MNKYIKNSNNKISKLYKELVADSEQYLNTCENENEKSKINLALLYYKMILNGCVKYSNDVNSFIDKIKDVSDSGSFNCLVECMEKKVPETTIELSDNPPIHINVAPVKEPDIDFNKISLNKKNALPKRGTNVYDDHAIVLDENPPIDIDVAEVYNQEDIVLDENPPIDIDVAEVYNQEDIVLDENPPIDVDVAEVYNQEDIVLDENPPIDVNVSDVKPVDLDHPAKSAKKENLELFEGLRMDVADVKDDFHFDTEEFLKQVEAERKAKRAKKEAQRLASLKDNK